MGIMTTISVIIIAIIFITIIGFGAQGRSELYHILRSKREPQGGGGSRPQPQWGGAGGNPHHREPQGGGGIPWCGGGRVGLAALHHICTCVCVYTCTYICMRIYIYACECVCIYIYMCVCALAARAYEGFFSPATRSL